MLYILINKKPIKDIFMKGVVANKFIERCLTVIFKHKEFKKIIISKLYNISFLFSPFMFKNMKMEEDYGLGEKKSIIMKSKTNSSRKDKIIKEFVLNIQENCNKDNNYWLGFIDTPMKQNYWVAEAVDTQIDNKEEEEEKPVIKKTPSAKSSSASKKGDKKKHNK